ncbi:uncharacterized protein Pyn_10095 [Prunus yedoensis var. nudiflora]|uniref:Uroporphyrinogen-III synthase n=1 Tax=Prunus yedoensis var. nudiflora TaxID=2094558 RepID=A0A314XXB2_PRUYE|nr:uncharacterized protein Pyn_10095 [Prunus yedoensis var. nudiflora]
MSVPTVAFTTPPSYGARLASLLALKGFNPISSPTLIVQPTPSTISALKPYLSPPPSLDLFSAIAFPSRTAITALSAAAADINHPLLSPHGDAFIIAALGKDAELMDDNFVHKLSSNPNRVRILVPPTATPSGLVEALGDGRNRRVLCPVPVVVGWLSLMWSRIFSEIWRPSVGFRLGLMRTRRGGPDRGALSKWWRGLRRERWMRWCSRALRRWRAY